MQQQGLSEENTHTPTTPRRSNNNNNNRFSNSPSIARRRKLTRTKSSPVLLSLVGGPIGGRDLPPLVGAPFDPTLSRYAGSPFHHGSQEKNVSGATSPTKTPINSPGLTRRARQLKPQLLRQASDPHLSQRLTGLKLIPSPPEGVVYSPRSNESSGCNSPRLINRTFGRSTEGLSLSNSSSGNLRQSFPIPNQQPLRTSPEPPPPEPPRPQSPFINNDSPFSVFHNATPAATAIVSPIYQPIQTPIPTRPGITRIRRTSGLEDASDVLTPSPEHETKRLPFPVGGLHVPADELDDRSMRSRSTWPPRQLQLVGGGSDKDGESIIQRPFYVDDETGEPVYHSAASDTAAAATVTSDWQRFPSQNELAIRQSGGGNLSVSDQYRTAGESSVNNGSSHPSDYHSVEEGPHPGHHVGGFAPAPITVAPPCAGVPDMLYDIKETHDEAAQEEENNNHHQNGGEEAASESEEDDDSEIEKLPEYQKPPVPTKNRVTQWLEGLQSSNGDDTNGISRTGSGTLLPDI